MAITIQQQPTSPGMVNSDLVWTVSSNYSTYPQFQYVCDLYVSGSGTLLQRLKQQPNPNARAVFDLGTLISQYTSTRSDLIKTHYISGSTVENRSFIVKFGEEFGSSVSSSVALYTGIGNATAGQPAKTGSAYYDFTNGLVEPNGAINWNFPSGSYLSYQTVGTAATASYDTWLTYAPTTQSMGSSEYATLSIYNGNFNGSTTVAQDVFWADVRFYNTASAMIGLSIPMPNITGSGYLGIVGPGPRTSISQSWSTASANQNSYTRLIHIGCGSQNLNEMTGGNINTNYAGWDYYEVSVYGQNISVPDINSVIAKRRFKRSSLNCGYDGVRFAWKNEFGVWDYYTFTLQTDSAVGIERQSYEQSFVDFSTATTSVYNKQRRGQSQFYNDLTQVKTANSNWLTQDEADWLRELFFSADVYYQDGTDVLPCVITSANVVEKTNPRTQKLFQYQIEFQPANQLRPRV